jgi:4-hydroxy-3-polyprenylbenzoate decarboxylase
LEGEISVTEKEKEGPLSEFTGYFEEPVVVNVFRVKCITHRKDPIYIMTAEGHRHSEGEPVRLVPQMASFHRQCKERISAFRNSYLLPAGRGYLAVISISKRLPGWGKQAIFQAASIPYVAAAVNVIIVVDADINPADPEQVIWAISTRVEPEKDVVILPPVGGIPSNPAAAVRPDVYEPTGSTDVSMCSKLGIDATLKMGPEEGRYRPKLTPVYPVKELMEKVKANWKEYGFEI